MKKNIRLLYIYRLCSNDYGPQQHVHALNKYCNIVFTISNLHKEGKNHFVRCNSSLFSIFYFQIYTSFLLLKYRKNYDIILHRISCGDFLIGFVCYLIGKRYIPEYNGDLIQDLIDRKKNIYFQFIQSIFNHFNFFISYRLYLVDSNLFSLFPFGRSQIKTKSLIINNGFEPIDTININKNSHPNLFSNSTINLGYLGSLAHREGLNSALQLLQDFVGNLSLIIVGGSIKEYKELTSSLTSKVNIKHFSNRSRVDALSILRNCDFFLFLREAKASSHCLSQGSPLKLLDYFYLQKPVIFSELPDHQKFIDMSLGIYLNDFISYLNGNFQFQFNSSQCISYTSTRSWSYVLRKFNTFIESDNS